MIEKRTQAVAQRTADDIWQMLQAKHPYPMNIQVVLTERCHLKCSHCYISRKERVEDRLSLAEYTRCFDDWAALGVLQMTLTGGEPALRKDLLDIVSAAGERHFYVRLKTSGTLIPEAEARAYLDAGLSMLEVSLYHASADAHDAFVGERGAFEKSLGLVSRFDALGAKVKINIMAMHWNTDGLSPLIGLCESRGFEYSIDPVIFVKQDGDPSPLEMRMNDEQLRRFMNDPVLNSGSPPDCGPHKKADDGPICSAGRTSVQVNPNGDVVLCEKLPWVLGNVRETSLREMWDTSPVRKTITELRWRDLKPCGVCRMASMCGHCPGSALAETGDLKSAVPFECAVTRARVSACETAGRG